MSIARLIRMSGHIFDCLHDGVAIVDVHGRIIYVNESNFRITGIAREQLIGKHVLEAVPLSHVPQVLESRQELIGVQSEVNGRQLLSNIVPVIVDNRFEGVISIFRDLTEVMEMNVKLQEAHHTIQNLVRELESMDNTIGDMVVGVSKSMTEAVRIARKAAAVSSTVLINGESGTGKEVLARMIHRLSMREDKPFMTINCAAIPDTLLESELFGYEEGAFTGARKGGRPGLIELAEGGTLFLDEIGDMPLLLQAKILRVLQDRQVIRVGGSAQRKIDVRFIAATHRPLESMVASGQFREDLYYRICVIRIGIPPLRDRMEDLTAYTEHLMVKIGNRIGKEVPRIGRSAWKALLSHTYPGNIRELENLLEVAMVLDEDGILSIQDLPDFEGARRVRQDLGIVEHAVALTFESVPTMAEVEKAFLARASELIPSKKNLSHTLGIARSTLYRKLEEYDLLKSDDSLT